MRLLLTFDRLRFPLLFRSLGRVNQVVKTNYQQITKRIAPVQQVVIFKNAAVVCLKRTLKASENNFVTMCTWNFRLYSPTDINMLP